MRVRARPPRLDLATYGYAALIALAAGRDGASGHRLIEEIGAAQRDLARAWPERRDTTRTRFVLLLPLLREQAALEGLLRAVDRLEFPHDRVLVVPITTQREAREAGDRLALAPAMARALCDSRRRYRLRALARYSRQFPIGDLRAWAALGPDGARRAIEARCRRPTTREVLERLLAETSLRFAVSPVHYPGTEGNKATQMNHALRVLRARGAFAAPGHTYVGVYDADSRPSRLSLAAVAMLAEEERPPALQQYPIYLQPPGPRGAAMRIEAWLQTARSVRVEYPRQLRVNAAIAARRAAGPTFTYAIGHGEFLHASWLLDTGFPEDTPIDDLPTGFMLSLARRPIVPVPYFDFCGVADDPAAFARQTATWFASQARTVGPLHRARRFGPVPRLRLLRGALEQWRANVAWLGTGPLRLALLGRALGRRRWAAAGALGAALAVDAAVEWSLTNRLLDSHPETDHVSRLRFDPRALARPLFKSAGPWLVALAWLGRRSLADYKTER